MTAHDDFGGRPFREGGNGTERSTAQEEVGTPAISGDRSRILADMCCKNGPAPETGHIFDDAAE
ncbi:MAG TPA: hypothetical protein PK250_02000 [Syntrophobacter fumaroxidans]|nr:hypothetical protein [Syntrophobacter fumaroxidans]